MLIKRPSDIRSAEITDEQLYLNRREFMKTASGAALGQSEPLVDFPGADVGSA